MTDHTTFVEETDLDDDPETVDAIVNEDAETDPEPAEDPPAERGELVVRDDPPADEMRSAIERAAEHALENPGVPGRDEFLSLAAQARILSMSAAAPKEIQGDPHLAFHVALIGRDLGISPSAALELIDVIPSTKQNTPPQLSLSPQLLNGQIRRLGLGSIVPAIKTDRLCVAVVLGPNGRLDPRCKRTWPDHWTNPADPTAGCACRDLLGDYEFSWEDAQMAGLAGPDCQPGVHSDGCRNWQRGKSCNQGYRTYPKRMLWWRASGFAADDYFPEAGLGLYTAEELGALVDENGRAVDPATAELPPGYEPAAVGAGRSAGAEVKASTAETIAAFQERIDEIKKVAPAAEALRAIWTEEIDGHPRLPPLPKLRENDERKAEAAIASIEARIRKGEWPVDETPDEDVPDVEPGTPAEVPDEAPPSEDETGAAGEEHSNTGDPIVDEIVDAVRALPLADVIDELAHRNISVRGNEQAKRQRLAQARYEDRIAASSSASQESEGGDGGEDPETPNGAETATEPAPTAGG